MAGQIPLNPRDPAQLRKAMWEASKKDAVLEAEVDAIQADYVSATSVFGTDDVLAATDGVLRKVKATAIDKDNVVQAAAAYAVDDVLIASDGTGKGTKATAIDKDNVVQAASAFGTDNAVLRADGIGRGAQFSSSTIDDTGQLTLRSTSAMMRPQLGSEQLSESDWTSAGWTGSWGAGWTHSTGNTNVLSNTLAAVINSYYAIIFTVTGRTAGSFLVTFGGVSSTSYTASDAFGPRATSTDNLQITPTSTFDGTIVISVKEITGSSLGAQIFLDDGNIAGFQIRHNSHISDMRSGLLAIGKSSGGFVLSDLNSGSLAGTPNVLFGHGCGTVITSGGGNVAVGNKVLSTLTTGRNNMGLGNSVLQALVSGNSNVGIGTNVMLSTITGDKNTGVGRGSLFAVNNGDTNTGIGYYAGGSVTSGSGNTFIGNGAGYNASQLGTAVNSTGIGGGAFTITSNQFVCGNTSVTRTDLRGNVGIGATPPTGGTANSVSLAQTNDPTGIASNSAGIFVKDVSGTAHLFGFPETGPVVRLTGVTRGATASVADGGTITHSLGTTPVGIIATGTIASEIISVTAIGATTFTVAIKTILGAPGTTQTIYWETFS